MSPAPPPPSSCFPYAAFDPPRGGWVPAVAGGDLIWFLWNFFSALVPLCSTHTQKHNPPHRRRPLPSLARRDHRGFSCLSFSLILNCNALLSDNKSPASLSCRASRRVPSTCTNAPFLQALRSLFAVLGSAAPGARRPHCPHPQSLLLVPHGAQSQRIR